MFIVLQVSKLKVSQKLANLLQETTLVFMLLSLLLLVVVVVVVVMTVVVMTWPLELIILRPLHHSQLVVCFVSETEFGDITVVKVDPPRRNLTHLQPPIAAVPSETLGLVVAAAVGRSRQHVVSVRYLASSLTPWLTHSMVAAGAAMTE